MTRLDSSGFSGAKPNHVAPRFRASQVLLKARDARGSVPLILVKHLPCDCRRDGVSPTELAVYILHHHHIRTDIGLVICVEVSSRELVQNGWVVRDNSG